MRYTKKVPYFKKGDIIDKAARNLPEEQREAILKISSAQKEQERKDRLSSVGAGFRIPTAAVVGPVDTRSGQIENTVGKKAAKTRGEAFQAARKRGDKEFVWKGKRYHTRTAEEEAERRANDGWVSPDWDGTLIPVEEVARRSRLRAFGTEGKPAEETVSVANVNTPAPAITEEMADESTNDEWKSSNWDGTLIPVEEVARQSRLEAAEAEEAVSAANVNTPAPARTENNSGNWLQRGLLPSLWDWMKYHNTVQQNSVRNAQDRATVINAQKKKDKAERKAAAEEARKKYWEDNNITFQRRGGWLFQQGGQMPQGDKLHLRNIWERMFGITPDYTPVNSQESITSYMDNTHKGPVEKRVIRKEVPYANLHSTMSIRNPGTNKADTTFTAPSGTKYDMNDVRSGKAPSGYSYKFFRKPAGYFQQGGQMPQEGSQEELVLDFAVRYLVTMGVPEEDIMDPQGNLNPEHQQELEQVFNSQEIDWSDYAASPDEYMQQFIGNLQAQTQMARKGAKLKRLSQLRIYKK